MPMKIQPLARFSKNKITHCDVLNIDDIGECFVNGVLAKKVSGGKDSGWIDITSYLTKPSNSVYFRLTNKIKGWTYGFQIRKNGIVFWQDECGKTGSRGCKNEDRTKGVVFEKKLTVTLYPKLMAEGAQGSDKYEIRMYNISTSQRRACGVLLSRET